MFWDQWQSVVWDRRTGRPFTNAIVWQCTRTQEICDELAWEGGKNRFRQRTGLPLAAYFSGPKIRWIMDQVPEAKAATLKGNVLFGTMETWIIWWLTGGPDGGAHVTDVTNAGRTLLMDLTSLNWDQEILQSCKACNVNPWECFDDILRRIMGHPLRGLRELLPDQWKPLPKDDHGLIIHSS